MLNEAREVGGLGLCGASRGIGLTEPRHVIHLIRQTSELNTILASQT